MFGGREITKIVCLGDSITWGFPFGPDYSWVRLVAERSGLTLINQGINGDTTEQMWERFQEDVVALEPSHVIVLGGANDIIIRESRDRTTYNLAGICQEAIKNGITPVLGLPTPMEFHEYEARLSKLRDWIRQYARENGLTVIDFDRAFRDPVSGTIRLDLLLDGGHPTIQGYAAMAEVVPL
ncbi:MAG: GDSL family lipase [Firmicutes bacterium]|nr:GDSL family lipase [Bacillota bacterium]